MFIYIFLFSGHKNPSLLINSCKFLFQNARTDDHLALLVRILTNELIIKSLQPYNDKGGYFSAVLEEVLTKQLEEFTDDDVTMGETCTSQIWHNLLTLLKYVCSVKKSNTQII